MKNICTIPNLMSLFRLCLIPLITTTYSLERFSVAALLLVLSGVTDVLDGFIARKFNQISDFGKLIDPVADKLTVAAVVFALLMRHSGLWLIMAVLFIKEFTMLVCAYILYKQGARPAESKLFGKVSTFVLYLIIFTFMITDLLEVVLPTFVVWLMTVVSCLCMLLAAVQYYRIFIGIKKGTYNIETEKFEGESAQ